MQMTGAFAALCACWLVSASEPRVHELRAEGPVWDVTAEDFSGDGVSDALAFCCDDLADTPRKWLSVFVSDGQGGYGETPAANLPLPDKAGAVFLAEIDGKPPKEVVAVHGGGAVSYRYEEGMFREIGETLFSSLLPTGCRQPVFLRDTAQDLTGDGVDEWLIPAPGGFEFFRADGRVAQVSCDMSSEYRRGPGLVVTHRVPVARTFTLEGASKPGVAFLSDRRADFVYGENWEQSRTFRIPLNPREKWEATTAMDDIDGNGLPDLVVSQVRGSVDLQVITQIYMAQSPFTYPAQPTYTFEAKGAIAAPAFEDINGDEHPDLLFVKIPMGVKTFVNYFLFRSIDVQMQVHLYDGMGYPATPDYEQTISVSAPEGKRIVAYAAGDFNGDGRTDIALGSGEDSVLVHTGEAKRFIGVKPWKTLAMPAFGTARAVDLFGKGRDAIILYHPGAEGREEIQVATFEP